MGSARARSDSERGADLGTPVVPEVSSRSRPRRRGRGRGRRCRPDHLVQVGEYGHARRGGHGADAGETTIRSASSRSSTSRRRGTGRCGLSGRRPRRGGPRRRPPRRSRGGWARRRPGRVPGRARTGGAAWPPGRRRPVQLGEGDHAVVVQDRRPVRPPGRGQRHPRPEVGARVREHRRDARQPARGHRADQPVAHEGHQRLAAEPHRACDHLRRPRRGSPPRPGPRHVARTTTPAGAGPAARRAPAGDARGQRAQCGAGPAQAGAGTGAVAQAVPG